MTGSPLPQIKKKIMRIINVLKHIEQFWSIKKLKNPSETSTVFVESYKLRKKKTVFQIEINFTRLLNQYLRISIILLWIWNSKIQNDKIIVRDRLRTPQRDLTYLFK